MGLALLMPFLFGVCYSTHTYMKPQETFCIGIDAEAGDSLIWNMESVPNQEALRCVAYFIKTPTSNITIKPLDDFNEQTKKFKAGTKGTFSMCVNNSSNKAQIMLFSFKLENSKEFHISNITTTNDTDKIESVSKLLLEKTREISEKLDTNQTKEMIYSKLSEKMDSRILLWSILHFITVIVLCCTQIYYINSFFEIKTRV